MKNILFATTALVATAGIAAADVTFSGSGEAGIYRTGKTDAVTQKLGLKAGTASANGTTAQILFDSTTGLLKTVDATGSDATDDVATANDARIATRNVTLAERAVAVAEAGVAEATTEVALANAKDTLAAKKAALVVAKAILAKVEPTAAAKAVKAGDMTAYSGYQADVTLSTETDSGIKFTMGFDLEAGLMADKDDDIEMDTKDGSIANSTLTVEANGYTLVIGQDEIDDLYDDSQNGDISLSGAMNGLSFTVVHDFEDSVKAAAAYYKAGSAAAAQHDAATDALEVSGGGEYTAAVFKDAVAAVNEGTSVKLGYTMGNATLGLVATSANDRNNSANKITLGYTVSDTLSFSVAHDSQGKRDAITSASVTYAIDALTITAKYADDKNHAGNTNKNGKASTDLSIGYAQGPISATFATNESSEWEVITSYDLGGGASAFATVDHSEFAVAGLSFAF